MFFNKAAIFTDIHFGEKSNSVVHNQDCLDFVDWFCNQAKINDCETCIFMGDWHHHRATLNVSTLNYTMKALEKLNSSFQNVYIITGNHDLYYREKRDVHSIPMGNIYKNITIVDKPLIKDNCAIVPWLVGEEWKDIVKLKSKYMFGHFELPKFKMNAMVEMPDHGGLKKEHFTNQDYVLTGHFHMRQQVNNVHYIGNPFGHNFSDVWDFKRGMCVLKWGEEPTYIDYALGPKYISVGLAELLENTEKYLSEKIYAKVQVDCEISYEEASFIKEQFIQTYKLRDLKLIASKDEEHKQDTQENIKFETVDQIVLEQLDAINSDNYVKEILLSIYNSLED